MSSFTTGEELLGISELVPAVDSDLKYIGKNSAPNAILSTADSVNEPIQGNVSIYHESNSPYEEILGQSDRSGNLDRSSKIISYEVTENTNVAPENTGGVVEGLVCIINTDEIPIEVSESSSSNYEEKEESPENFVNKVSLQRIKQQRPKRTFLSMTKEKAAEVEERLQRRNLAVLRIQSFWRMVTCRNFLMQYKRNRAEEYLYHTLSKLFTKRKNIKSFKAAFLLQVIINIDLGDDI